MPDQRLNSRHLLDLPFRREDYRHARESLLAERGWLTQAGEKAFELMGPVEDWPSLVRVRPDQILPGTKFLLVDQRADRVYSLQVGLNTIGRLPDNDIVFEESCISRRHCVILVHVRGGCELHDTASLNGTFVNGQRVHGRVRLASGDRIRVYDRPLLRVSEKDYQSVVEGDDHPKTMMQ